MDSQHSEWESLLQSYLGTDLLAGLVQSMLDHATPPTFFPPREGSLLDLYNQALAAVQAGLAGESEETVAEIRSRMPWIYQKTDLPHALLSAGIPDYFFSIPDSVFASPAADSRVMIRLPSLMERVDDDGLIDCTNLDATSHCLIVGDQGIQYHQFLRRHFGSNINDRLIATLLSVAERPGNTLHLAIDDRRIAPASEVPRFFEEDYWWGPPLTEEWLDDPHQVGRTVHEDPEGEESLLGFLRFEVYWRMASDSEKVVQMEEIVATSQEHICDYRLLRYLHAIRDTAARTFTHCDGAVRAYDDPTFESRSQNEIARSIQANRYRKVFRIDGSITTAEWSDIVAKWFRHNSLVTEYLAGVAQPDTQ
jgi:hypothetical protein